MIQNAFTNLWNYKGPIHGESSDPESERELLLASIISGEVSHMIKMPRSKSPMICIR